MKYGMLLSLFFLSLAARGETTTVETEQGFLSNLSAQIEFRPTTVVGTDNFVTENNYSLEYALTPNTVLGWTHYFNTNLANGNGGEGGLNLTSDDAYLRAKFKKLWVSETGQWDFGIQPRLYLPFEAGKRDNGYVGSLRTYFDVNRKLSPSVSLTGSLVPILHAFNQAATNDGTKAHKAFEIRYIVTTSASLANRLSLKFPLTLKQHHYREAGFGAAKSNGWDYKLDIYPELVYGIDDNFSVGLGFESASFIQSDFGGFTVAEAFENGKAQLILQAAL